MAERLTLVSRGMQAAMAAVVVAGVLTDNLTWVPAAAASLAVSEVPSILRRDLRIVLPVGLNLWLVLALFLHVIGGVSGFYDNLPGWDHITHAMSSSLIAALGFVTVAALDKYVDSMYLPTPFLAFFIVMFTMAMGVSWELMEYVMDEITGSNMQYSLSDTMVDLLFDSFAGFIVAGVGMYYLRHVSRDRVVDSLQLDEAKDRVAAAVKRSKERTKGK
ncbi:MAG: hypothetical protein QG582_967 [Candidatus Thermoplasmatota archaeon]|nr:hypothetical protein [Candidatus Thermoplasmatota archaeon]